MNKETRIFIFAILLFIISFFVGIATIELLSNDIKSVTGWMGAICVLILNHIAINKIRKTTL